MRGAAGRRRGDRRSLGSRGIEQPRNLGRHFPREQRALGLERIVLAELQTHQLAPDHRVGGPPRLGIVAQNQELRRQSALVAREERIDPIGIGLKIGLGLRAKRGEAAFRKAIEAQGADEPVDPDEVGAGDLGQPSLSGAALDFHLIQPLARVDIAERPRRVVHRRREDMRDGVAVAVDPHLAAQSRQVRRAAVVGHRPVEFPGDCREAQQDQCDGDDQRPFCDANDHGDSPSRELKRRIPRRDWRRRLKPFCARLSMREPAPGGHRPATKE